MKSYALFQQYIWLVNTIYRARRITLEEINRKWVDTEMSEGLPMVRSTFNRHKDAIEDMFGIYIECDRRDGFRYHIGNAEVLEEDSIQNWMLNTLSVSGILNESRAMNDKILLETIPSSGEHLSAFIEALKANVRVIVKYRRYGAEYETAMEVFPYCVKLANRRWYAVVQGLRKDGYFVLAFDRIKDIRLTETKFVPNDDFDAKTYFSEVYGVVRTEELEFQTVRIRVYGREVFYLRDLPLHHSQKEVATEDGYSDFELQLRPTAEFFSPLLARGPFIKVLEPQWLADEIKALHQAAYRQYLDE